MTDQTNTDAKPSLEDLRRVAAARAAARGTPVAPAAPAKDERKRLDDLPPPPERAETNPIKRALANCRQAFVAVGIFSFFINLLLFTSPLYMMQVYDRVLASRNGTTLIMLTVICGGLYATSALLEWVRSRLLVRAGAVFDSELSARVFRAIFHRSLRIPGGAQAQALRDMDTVREFAAGSGLSVLCDAPWAPLFIAVAFLLHPVLGFVCLGGGAIIFALAVANELMTRKHLKAASVESVGANAFAEASLRNSEALQAMGMMPAVAERWQMRHQRVMGLQAQAADRGGMLQVFSKFIRVFLQSSILGVGAWLAIQDQISAGSIIACSIILGRALAPIELAVGHWRGFINARSAYERLVTLLKDSPAERRPMPLPAPKGALSVDKAVVVPPQAKQPSLKGVSFELQPGEILGVVGPSAAGKSSLARILVGVWPLAQGIVRLDQADMHLWDRAQLGPHVGYLPQDVELFDGTVAENIARFGKLDAAAVVAAAQQAGVHELILQLPEGYDTKIGEGGRALSGGQRQRIALARALYMEPSFVVLDEPNSNLDTMGEQALVEAVTALKARKATTVVITHRLSILGAVDKILVLNDGQVELFGTRDEVMGRLARPTAVPSDRKAAVEAPRAASHRLASAE